FSGGEITNRIELFASESNSLFATYTSRPSTIIVAPAAHIQANRSRLFRRIITEAGTPVCDPLSRIHFSSSWRSFALCQRSSGAFARHFFTTRSSADGIIGRSVEIGEGSRSRTAAITLAVVFPSK